MQKGHYMDVDGLSIFVEVMRAGSFAAVARAREVAPSSISRTIASMEAELGIQLFKRTTRRMTATEAGRAYFERIEPLVRELTQAADEAASLTREARGTLKIAAPVAMAMLNVVPFLGEFQKRHPEIRVNLTLTDSGSSNLLADGIDVAFQVGRLQDSAGSKKRLFSTYHVMVASPRYLRIHGEPAEPADLDNHDCLVFPSPFPGRDALWRFRGARGEVRKGLSGRCVLSNVLALRDAALAGLGVTTLPEWVVGKDIAAGKLVAVMPDYDVTITEFDAAAWLVFPKSGFVPVRTQAFVDFMTEKCAQGAPSSRA